MSRQKTLAWRKFIFSPMYIGRINSWRDAYRWADKQILRLSDWESCPPPQLGIVIVVTKARLYDKHYTWRKCAKRDPLGLGIAHTLEKLGPYGYRVVKVRGAVVMAMERFLASPTRQSYAEVVANLAKFRIYCSKRVRKDKRKRAKHSL